MFPVVGAAGLCTRGFGAGFLPRRIVPCVEAVRLLVMRVSACLVPKKVHT